MRYRKIALPLCVYGVGFGQTISDGEREFVALQRGPRIAKCYERVADLFSRDGQIALPSCACGIRLGEAVDGVLAPR